MKISKVTEYAALNVFFFQSITAYKIDSEHTRDYTKLSPVCKVELLQATANKLEVLSYLRVDFWRF